MSPKVFGLALLLSLPPALTLCPGPHGVGPRSAEAAVSIAMSLEELVGSASYVVVATATERQSRWEDLGGARRIVTYTRLTIERAVVGEPGKEVWVRTLGGVVGKVGQYVSGDARIALGERSMLFLTRWQGAVVVSGMAQGHFPLVSEGEGAGRRQRLASSPDAGSLLPRPGPTISARDVLVGAALDNAIAAVLRVRRSIDAKK